jgi:hypothetical protein
MSFFTRLVCDSISAGPHLLATNDQGVTDIAIPWNDENIANVLEHASNTAVALRASTQSALFVTVDGADGCSQVQPVCLMMERANMAPPEAGYFFITTRFQRQETTRIYGRVFEMVLVMRSRNKKCGKPVGSQRPVFAPLFILSFSPSFPSNPSLNPRTANVRRQLVPARLPAQRLSARDVGHEHGPGRQHDHVRQRAWRRHESERRCARGRQRSVSGARLRLGAG